MLKSFKFLFFYTFFLFPSVIFAEFEKENSSIFISSSSTAQYLASHYGSRFGIGGGGGGGNSSNKNIHHIQAPLSLGYHLGKDVNLNNGVDLKVAFEVALNTATIVYPDGVSYFIERASVNSKSIEIMPNLSFLKSFIDNQLIFMISGGYTFFWSEQRFNFGDWEIYDHHDNVLPSVGMALSYKSKRANKIGYYIGIKTMSEETYLDLGVRFFLFP